MKNWHLYRGFFTTILINCALNSWGSVTAPQLSFDGRSGIVPALVMDTVPAKTQAPAAAADNPAPLIEEQPAPTVTKRVPRSRKKLKPARVNVPQPPAAPVIKPRIVIKKITVKAL